MAAPGFDSESNLHRAGSDWLIRMRMEAWVEAESSLQEKLLLTGRGRLMEGHRFMWPVSFFQTSPATNRPVAFPPNQQETTRAAGAGALVAHRPEQNNLE